MSIARIQAERDDSQLLVKNEAKKHSAEMEELRLQSQSLQDELRILTQKQTNEVRGYAVHL